MTQLTCPNKECNYNWDYNGVAIYYTSCPRCKWNVRINRTEEELELIEQIEKIKEEERKGSVG